MFKFTKKEVRDLIIAFIVLSISFSISNVGFDVHGFISILPIVMFGVGIGFLLREIGHKYAAMLYGYDAEFKMWPIGLLIAFLTSFIGWVFAIPGEAKVYADNLTDEIRGKISLAGPMANILLSIIFIIIATLAYPLKSYSEIFNLIFIITTVGFSVNNFLAAFNLIPVYSLDGLNVMKWNKSLWFITFVLAVGLMLTSICIGAEKMVVMIINSV